MDVGQVSFIGLVVITIIGALKDVYPMSGNMTRLAALIVGGIVGLIAQVHLLPGVSADVVTGIMSGVAAVATMSIADRVGVHA